MRYLMCVAVVLGATTCASTFAAEDVLEPALEKPAGSDTGTFPGAASGAETRIFTGAGVYTLPLPLPPGRLGMTPSLELTYNTQARPEQMGVWPNADIRRNWHLGFPVIERKKGTTGDFVYRRGFASAELVACATGNCDGVWETGEYRARIDDGRHVRFFFNGEHWVTYDKKGNKSVFGQNVRAYYRGAVFRWLLEREEDPDRNAVVYSYWCSACCATCTRPSSIQYPAMVDAFGNVIAPGAYAVSFSSVPSWTISVHETASNSLLYKYEAGSEAVTLVGGDGTTKKTLLTISTEYAKHEAKEWSTGGTVAYRNSEESRSCGKEVAVSGDFDGDGKTDIARTEGGIGCPSQDLPWLVGWSVSLSTGSGFVTPAAWWSTKTPLDMLARVLVADFDGDGRDDIAHGTLGSQTFELLRSTGVGFETIIVVSPVFQELPWVGAKQGDVAVLVGDFNGDRRADIASARSRDSAWVVALALPTGTFQTSTWSLPEAALEALADGLESVVVGDFTGDGRSDIGRVRGTGAWKMAIANSDGAGFTLEEWVGGPQFRRGQSVFGVDRDGNGMAEVTPVECGAFVYSCDRVIWDGLAFVENARCNTCEAYRCSNIQQTCDVCRVQRFPDDCGSTNCTWSTVSLQWIWTSPQGFQTTRQCNVGEYQSTGEKFLGRGGYLTAREFSTLGMIAPVAGWRNGVRDASGVSIAAEVSGAAGEGLWLPFNVTTPWCTAQDVLLGDFNGSGATDIACAPPGSTTWHVIIDGDISTTTFVNAMGGKTRMTLKPAASLNPAPGTGASPRHVLRSPVQVVTEVAVEDGTGSPVVTRYDYGGGYATDKGEFLGFRLVQETLPNGVVRKTWFHQETDRSDPEEESDFKGLPQRLEVRSPSGELLQTTAYAYTRGTGGAGTYPAYALLRREDVEERGGANEPSEWVTRSREIFHDEFGNVTTVQLSGTDAAPFTISYAPIERHSGLRGDPRRTVHVASAETLLDLAGKVIRKRVVIPYPVGSAPGREAKPWKITRSYCELLPLDDPKRAGCTDPEISFDYNERGLVEQVTDAKGITTRVGYDARTGSYPQSVTRGVGTAKERVSAAFTYDYRFGTPECVTDEAGVSRCTKRDLFGRPKSRTVERGAETFAETSYVYIEGFPFEVRETVRLSATPGVEGADSWSYFDGLGREVQRVWTGEGGRKWALRSFYDASGRQWASAGPYAVSAETYPQALPAGAPYPWQVAVYDSNGALAKVVRSDKGTASPLPVGPAEAQGPTTAYAWTPRAVTMTDPDGRVMKHVSDALGRPRKVIEFSGVDQFTTQYGYTLDGLLEAVVDAKGTEVTRAHYDPLGRRTHLADRDLGTWEYRYDSNDNLQDVIDPKGQAVTYSFDEIDRLDSACFWAKPAFGDICGHIFDYTYDVTQDAAGPIDFGIGRLGEVTDGSVTTRHRYDALGRIVRETRSIDGLVGEYVTDLEYDVGGRLRGMVYPADPGQSSRFSVDYEYHPGTALLQSVTGSDGVLYATFTGYTGHGVPGTVVRPGVTSTYASDPWSGMLSGIASTNAAGGAVVNLEFGFSPAGQVRSISDGVAHDTRSFRYDRLGRLRYAMEEAPPAGGALWFWPDAVRPHALQSANTSTANYEFTHDANGNVSSGYDLSGVNAPQLRTFSYDTGALFGLLNMPASIARAPLQPVEMLYDDTGARARKRSGANTVFYFGRHYEIRNNVPTRYVLVGGSRLAAVSPGQTLHFHNDHQGSTIALTSASGTVVWSGRYTPHGELARESGVRATSYLYSGQELDEETGLYYFGARYYDPAAGRFTSPDSIVPRTFDPQALNRYAFARNDPLSRVDPDGHWDLEICFPPPCGGGGGGGGGGGRIDIPGPGGSGPYWQPPPGLVPTPGGGGGGGGDTISGFGVAPPATGAVSVGSFAGAAGAPGVMGSFGEVYGVGAEAGRRGRNPNAWDGTLRGFLRSFDYFTIAYGGFAGLGGAVHLTIDRNGYLTLGPAGGVGAGGKSTGVFAGIYQHGEYGRATGPHLRSLNTGWAVNASLGAGVGYGVNLPWRSGWFSIEPGLTLPGVGVTVGYSWELGRIEWLSWFP